MIEKKPMALVASANDLRKTLLARELERLGLEVRMASRGSDAVGQLERSDFAAVIVDESLGDLSALELGLAAREILGSTSIVLLLAPSYRECVERLSPQIHIQCFDDVNGIIATLRSVL